VVDRISRLQQETQTLEADKARLQKQLAWLPKASNVDLKQLPPAYKELIQTLSSELNAIIQNYNRLLDEYLTATITSLVTVKQSPIITREAYSSVMILAGIVFMSFFLAIFMMSIEHLYQKAKAQMETKK
jgi:predicted PurR-regulated permease PerM